MAGSDRLSRLQHRGVHALLTCRTVAEAAAETGVGERTMRRWQRDPEFVAAVRGAARESARDAASALLAVQRRAVAVLSAALGDDAPAVRLRAAGMVLDHGERALAIDVDERLDRVEQRLEEGSWPMYDAGSDWPRPKLA